MSMILADASYGNQITISTPQYGYSALIHMSLHYAKYPNGYDIYDDGSVYDWRACSIPSLLIPPSEQSDLADFFNSLSKGRGNQFRLLLGWDGEGYNDPTGFYPFGADMGDYGNFLCTLPEYNPLGPVYSPWLWFQNKIFFQYVSADSNYTPPASSEEGGLWLQGKSSPYTLLKLLCPQQPAKPVLSQHLLTQRSATGVITSTDAGPGVDNLETEFELLMNTGNTAALIGLLIGTQGREDAINITPESNSYLFGIERGSLPSATSCKLLTNELNIIHSGFNRFKTVLRFSVGES